MKKTTLIFTAFLCVLTITAFSQSKSFESLKSNFDDQQDVFSFGLDGLFCKGLLSMTGDHDFTEAVQSIKAVDFITIPKHLFAEQHLTIKGFKKYLDKDNFEFLASIKDHGDDVEIYLQQNGNKRDRYLVWIEGDNDITALEIKGSIDIQKLMKKAEKTDLAYEQE